MKPLDGMSNEDHPGPVPKAVDEPMWECPFVVTHDVGLVKVLFLGEDGPVFALDPDAVDNALATMRLQMSAGSVAKKKVFTLKMMTAERDTVELDVPYSHVWWFWYAMSEAALKARQLVHRRHWH